MSGLEIVALAINGAVGLLILAALVIGWWQSRDSRRRDEYRLDIDADAAAEQRARRIAEWGRRGASDE